MEAAIEFEAVKHGGSAPGRGYSELLGAGPGGGVGPARLLAGLRARDLEAVPGAERSVGARDGPAKGQAAGPTALRGLIHRSSPGALATHRVIEDM